MCVRVCLCRFLIGEFSQAGPGKSDALQLDVSFAAVSAVPSANLTLSNTTHFW